MDDDLARRLENCGDLIKERASTNAMWSRRIPASLKVDVEDDAVTVSADPSIAPQARAFEQGLRHPLNYPTQHGDSWGNTPHRPFLEDALRDQTNVCVEELANVITDWTMQMGWHEE